MKHRYQKRLLPNSVALWSIQDPDAPSRLRRDGRLRADGRYVGSDFRPAYQWLVGELVARIGPPPRGVRYPIWAWVEEPSPDKVVESLGGRACALLELEVDPARVARTDFMRWHSVLNNNHLDLSEAEFEAMEHADEAAVRASWQRVFDLDTPRDPEWELETPVVQACLWEVRPADVRQVTQFAAR